MPHFFYKALKPDGSVKTGELTANDRADAFRLLDRQGLQPVHLDVGGVSGVLKNGVAKSPAPGKKPAPGKTQAAKKAVVAPTTNKINTP